MTAVRFPIRAMTKDDIDAVMVLAARVEHAPQWPRATYGALVDGGLDAGLSPRRIALMAENGKSSTVAGFAVASVTAPEAELESIAVAPEFRRAGVARALFEAVVSALRSAEVTEILLEVRPSNAAARGFYRSLGFTESGCRPGYYADPVEDALLLRLKLA
jgi:ribosomal-protein-alanine N-acetyltransferase